MDTDRQRPIVFVTAGGPHPWIIFNALNEAFGDLVVIREASEPRSALVRRRINKFGIWNGFGQTAMMAWSVLGKRLAGRRIERLIAAEKLGIAPPPGQKIIDMQSVNAPEFLAEIETLDPAVVFLCGCRLLAPETLSGIACPVLNYHAGITPKYRGMNGGYYALANDDAGNFGGTVHMVDRGVDTGAVLYQARGTPGADDSFLTYAYRQAAMSRGISVDAVRDALEGRLKPVDTGLPSAIWFHPTLWRYVWTGLTRGIW